MSKRIYSATPGSGLDIQATLNYNQYFEVDEDGFSETKAIKSDVLLRTRPSEIIDASGESEIQIAFDTYNTAIVTINSGCEFTVYPKDNETCYIYVLKSAANVVTFNGATLMYSCQTKSLVLVFKIESVNGVFTATQINNQFNDSLSIGDLIPLSGTVTTFTYFKSTINNNICSFEGSFIYTPASSVSAVIINISNWNVTKFNTGSTSCNSFCQAAAVIGSHAAISETVLSIYFNSAIATATTILINGSFRVK